MGDDNLKDYWNPEDLKKIDSVVNLYKVFREYIQFEAHLVNLRITWTLTLSGFMFAAYGVVISHYLDFLAKCQQQPTFEISAVSHVLTLICLFGGLFAVLGFCLIRFAQKANVGVEAAFDVMTSKSDLNLITKNIFQKCETGDRVFKSSHFLLSDRKQNFDLYTFDRKIALPGIRGGGSGRSVGDSYHFSQGILILLIIAWIALFCCAKDITKGVDQSETSSSQKCAASLGGTDRT